MTIRSNRILARRKKSLTVRRFIGGAFVNHKWSEGTPEDSTIFANPRPLMKSETKFVPDGERADFFRVIDCSELLYTLDDKNNIKGDIIMNHLGWNWRVIDEMKWGEGDRHNWHLIQKFERYVATP